MPFDLHAYLARIGWEGPPAPDLATLRGLIARHAAAIPFEGIEALLGRTPALDPAGLQAKLVGARRGGWCFEQNSLFALALRAIGFRSAPLLARVRYGVPAEVAMPRTHLVLRVDLPEGPHLADVGFGGVTVTAPLALRTGPAQPTPHGPVRLTERPDGLMLKARLGAEWTALYLVGSEPQQAVDIDAANWLVANRPGGIFTANLIVTRAPPGEQVVLLNRRLTRRDPTGGESVTLLEGPALGETLRGQFGIALPPGELAALEAALAEDRPGRIPAPG
ncbi:arylamine N-acetyltransferase family protein [Paracraurococcus lichenis]|uniref:Arylamine N-acetyltransferase n=1 Tax=Paracraurococcus lichenis TaxID=3064888 RepID=A0ABT9DX86_9PROT|nr:arylamine N-acetyltransferase [Paracraurococcus sp. LOR1-02]MDO9708506.1 arylamine N-acetyltransferase [Paracraurococcus sp. LOR1-02]